MLRCIARPWVFLAGLSAATGCLTTTEPTSPCPALDLGRAEAATFVAPEHAPIVAITHGDDESFVAYRRCDEGGTSCWIERAPLDGLPSGSQVLVTASGTHVVGIVADEARTTVMSWEVTADGVEKNPGVWFADSVTEAPAVLVGSMRGTPGKTDWVIARTGPRTDGTRRLLRYRPGQVDKADDLAKNVKDLLVVALGERYLVGRRVHSGGEETLYLVDVLDDFAHGEARPLMRGPTFSRVMLSPGDSMVIATAGEGEDAETFVFDVADGTLLDRFSGGTISGRARGEELPGMRAVSPDGSALAYRTPGGALALRSLDQHASCLVRSSTGGTHELAGFSASGVLYLEASTGLAKHRVYAFDPQVRRLTALGDPEGTMKLAAVPARDPVDADGVPVGHWALGVGNGRYAELRHDPIAERGVEEALNLDEVVIIPREDDAIWLVDTRRGEGTSARTLAVHRLGPRVDPDSGALEIDRSAPTVPEAYDAAEGDPDPAGEGEPEPLDLRLDPRPVCVSTGGPGLAAFGCGRGSARLLFEYRPAAGEQSDPGAPPVVQPDDPETPPADAPADG